MLWINYLGLYYNSVEVFNIGNKENGSQFIPIGKLKLGKNKYYHTIIGRKNIIMYFLFILTISTIDQLRICQIFRYILLKFTIKIIYLTLKMFYIQSLGQTINPHH